MFYADENEQVASHVKLGGCEKTASIESSKRESYGILLSRHLHRIYATLSGWMKVGRGEQVSI